IGATPPEVFFSPRVERSMTLDLSHAPDAPARRRGRYVATVSANVPLCREHNRLPFHLPALPDTRPGQFVQVRCRDVDDAPLGDFPEHELPWTPGQPVRLGEQTAQPDLFRPTPILRRPFSIAGR